MKNGKDNNMKLYVTYKENTVRNGVTSFECKQDESSQIVPNNMTERQCLYICGQIGSGKSFFTTNYVKEYNNMFPKRNIYVISSIAKDK
jgi:tRNA A37 threonylcarbamoyladenosine biosynthesis protein TsaE